MTIQPKLVVDAKALYDLLKPEVQAASGSDKRTTIEVQAVTQDKLANWSSKQRNFKTMWVSSELHQRHSGPGVGRQDDMLKLSPKRRRRTKMHYNGKKNAVRKMPSRSQREHFKQ